MTRMKYRNIHNLKLKTDENNVKKTNTHSKEVSYVSYPSSQLPDNLVTLTPSKQSILSKIKTGFFTNSLILNRIYYLKIILITLKLSITYIDLKEMTIGFVRTVL